MKQKGGGGSWRRRKLKRKGECWRERETGRETERLCGIFRGKRRGGGGGGDGERRVGGGVEEKCASVLGPGHADGGGLTFMMPHCLLSSFFPDIARAARGRL